MVMGMCNYCQELGRVYEQEDTERPVFLICKRCISDVFAGLDAADRSRIIRQKHNLSWNNSEE